MQGCSPVHKQMQSETKDVREIQKFRPVFTIALYKATVDVMDNHLSGLLLIKKCPTVAPGWSFQTRWGLVF